MTTHACWCPVPQLLHFVFNMAENRLFWKILSFDKNRTKHGIRFISLQNVLDMHKFSKIIKLCKGDACFCYCAYVLRYLEILGFLISDAY